MTINKEQAVSDAIERDWQLIETAPKDGTLVWVKRVYEGRTVKEGWARWGVNSADAPMRHWTDGGLGGPIPPDLEYADTVRWLTEDRRYSFPTPTHWSPAASHPLEQQQAVSGDEVKRALRKAIKGTTVCHEAGLTNAEINGLVAAVSAALTASGMGQWRPIETAPREEFTNVVLIARDHGNRGVMPAIFDGDRWQSISIAGLMPFRDPTHWMPLPEPPRTALQEEGVERRD